MTGGSGRLGSVLKDLLPGEVWAPTSKQFDILDPKSVTRGVKKFQPDLIVHCAAYTDVAAAELDPATCFQINVIGTYNLYDAGLKNDFRLVTISTDHIFDGKKGMYKEEAPATPIGVYATSKYLAEKMVLMNPKNTVLRTSFIKSFPLPAAFIDKYFAGDTVDIIAADIALAVKKGVTGLWNIGGKRVSIYDIAKKLNPEVGKMKLKDNPINKVGLRYLKDVSLDTSKWQNFKKSLKSV
jgi:dTDP-4-dehydrorhamnose reductase